MQALVFDGAPRVVDDWPEPAPAPGEALVGVTLAGICSTDLEVVKGYQGFVGVMGHEFVGTVLEGPRRLLGRRVVGEINCPCRSCATCRAGELGHCPSRTVLGIAGRDGAFAERLALPAMNLHAVPDRVSDQEAVFVEPLAAAFRILDQVTVPRRGPVVVLGDGRLGQLCARVLALESSEVWLVGRHDEKLALAARLGLATAREGACPVAREAALVVDATGSPEGFAQALRTVRPRGTVVLKSTTAAGASGLNLAPMVVDEVTVVGSRCGPFATALRALAKGAVEVADLVSGRRPLAEGLEALAAARGGALKELLEPRQA